MDSLFKKDTKSMIITGILGGLLGDLRIKKKKNNN